MNLHRGPLLPMEDKVNAVELVRRIRDAQYKQIESKSTEEQIVFYRIKAQKANFLSGKSVQEYKERIAA